MGKSRLALEIAARHDTSVVSASPSERMWPYSGLSAVAAGLGGARGAAFHGVLAQGRDWPEHLLAEELSRTLHLVSDESSVLVIDDLDEMDSASVTVLSFVFGRLQGTGLAVVATAGLREGRHDFAGMAQTRIGRLSFEESVDLAGAVLGPGAAPAVLHNVAEFTGGDPGIIARVRLTPSEASGDEPLPLPLRLVDRDGGHRRRVGRLATDPRVAAVLNLLSVGPVFALERLRLVAVELGVELDTLLDDGLVAVHGDLARIADPALRLRHHASLPVDERRKLHARAAEEHESTHPAIFAWNASFASPDDDREHLLIAAVRLAREGDHASAIEFAERAMAGEVDEAALCRHLIDLGDALLLHGQGVRGLHYLRRAGTPAEPALRARAALARRRATAAIEHMVDETALAVAAEATDPRTTEHILCESALLHLWRGETARAHELITSAVEQGIASTETALFARLLTELGAGPMVDLGGDSTIEPPTGIDIAVETGCDIPIAHALLDLSAGVVREEYAVVRRRIRWLLESTPRPEPLWRDHLLSLLVSAEIRGGDPVGAREAVALWRREWVAGRTPDASSVLVLAAAAALDPLDAHASELVRQGRDLCRREGTPALLPWFAVIEGGLALAEGRFDDAVVSLSAAKDAAPIADPSVLRVDADLIEALWLSGRQADAQHALVRLEEAAARSPRRWTALALARSRAVCRSDRDGVTAFREAEAVYRVDDAPFERRRLARARERCVVSGTRAGAVRSTPRTDTRSRLLTPQEMEVVALVEQGLRNRDIAASLFISLRTVELRLTGVYRKLGVRSRAHLIAALRNAAS